MVLFLILFLPDRHSAMAILLGVQQINKMINSQLEANLREFAKTNDSMLFENKLFEPLKYLASSICKKNNIMKDLEYIIQDMVSEATIKLCSDYKDYKGTAKAFSYIVMAQFLSNQRKFNAKDKRNTTKTIFLEDIEAFDGHSACVIEVVYDELLVMKESLLNKKKLFEKLTNKLHKRVALKIIDAIENPLKYKEHYGSITHCIAKKSKCKDSMVRAVIEIMRGIIKPEPDIL